MRTARPSQAPAVSVIIPTHNRSASLRRTLAGLCAQTICFTEMEVLVVADGCTDDTETILAVYPAPFALYTIAQTGLGAATARNRGAAQAAGKLLLFLDDDIEPGPTLVAAHLRAHQAQPGQVVIGPYPPAPQAPTGYFHSQLRAWWEDKFCALAQSGHRFTYQDLLSGNFSLAATIFRQLNGFDETISDCGGEDYELGMRLITAQIPFTLVAEAHGYHHVQETTDLARGFQRARQEGRVDIRLGERHPELRPQLALASVQSACLRTRLLLRLLIFQWPFVGEAFAAQLHRLLTGLERVALNDYWHSLYRVLHGYWYWRGVADKLGSWPSLLRFVVDTLAAPADELSICDLDLSQGLAEAAQQLDRERPSAIRIRYGQQPVGFIPSQPGAEPVRGVHLRLLLQGRLAVPLLEALTIEGAIQGSPQLDRYRLFHSIRAKWIWFGPTDLNRMWFEQYSQWNQLDQAREVSEEAPSTDWAAVRAAEYTMPGLAEPANDQRWRARLYRALYRWHEPLYHWYAGRGWTWLTRLRHWIKQGLFKAVGELE